jgi:hypothetical protein
VGSSHATGPARCSAPSDGAIAPHSPTDTGHGEHSPQPSSQPCWPGSDPDAASSPSWNFADTTTCSTANGLITAPVSLPTTEASSHLGGCALRETKSASTGTGGFSYGGSSRRADRVDGTGGSVSLFLSNSTILFPQCTVDRTAIFPCTPPQAPGLPIISHPEINAKHPSSWWLGKGFSSDDMGDGPPKKHTKASAKRSQSLMTRFLTAPPDTSTETLLTWAETQPCHISHSCDGEYMIFACVNVALAIAVTDLCAATSRLQDLSNAHQSTPDQLGSLLNEIPLAVALRADPEHQRSTPRTPHDTTMLLAELLLGRPMNEVQHPTHRPDMILALQVMWQRCQDLNFTQGQQALERQLHFHTTDTLCDQITDQDKMDPSLFLAVARTTETQVELWEEDLALSPFPLGWMQATQLHDPDGLAHSSATFPACQLLSTCLKPGSILIGHGERHHFRIQFEQRVLSNDLKGLLLNLCCHLRTRAIAAPVPPLQQSIPAQLHEMQNRVSIFLPAHLFAQVRTATHLIPRNDLPHAIKTLWQECPMLACTQTYGKGMEVLQIREGPTATWTQLSYAQALTIPASQGGDSSPLQLSHMQQSNGVLVSNSIWTSDALLWMTTLRHLGVVQERTIALTTPPAKLITELIERLALVTANHIGLLRRSKLPQHVPQSPHCVNPSTPARVTFHCNQQEVNDTPISITHPGPRPLVHPAMVRYVPPSDALRPTSTRPKRARTVAQHSPLATEFQLLGDRELYTLRAYGTKPDDILIGAATAPGSYYAAYARTRITADANGVYPRLGQYTDKHRGKTPVIIHSSDLQTSDGSYVWD